MNIKHQYLRYIYLRQKNIQVYEYDIYAKVTVLLNNTKPFHAQL